MLLVQIGLLAGDVGEADRIAADLGLRFLELELDMVAPGDVEPASEQRLVDAIVLDREVLVPASVGGELGHEEMPRPIRFEADLGRELQRLVGMLVEIRVEHVVGEDGADLGLGEQQEAAELHADRHVRVEIVARRRDDPVAR